MESFNDDQSHGRPVLGRGAIAGTNPEIRRSRQAFNNSAHAPISSESTWQNEISNPPTILRRPTEATVNELTRQINFVSLNSNSHVDQCEGQKYNGSFGGSGDSGVDGVKWSTESSYQPSLNSSTTLNPYAQDFVPRSFFTNSLPVDHRENYQEDYLPNGTFYYDDTGCCEPIAQQVHDDDFIALSCLREFVDTISVRPNKYESNLPFLTDSMNSWIDEDPTVMSSAVNIIVDQAITDTQFRYNGVRLCIHLMDHLQPATPDQTFKNLLFQRCQRETSRRDSLLTTSTGDSYLRGLILFIGDLYSRCSEPDLAECLPALMETLIKHSSSENLKCVCQVLKLCGKRLEDYFNKKGSPEVKDIIEKLSASSTKSEISTYIRELVASVVEMQKNSWAPVAPKPAATFVNPYLNNNRGNEVSGPSTGENEEYNSYSDEEDYQTSYDFGACGDELDKDVCDAFEEFLKNSGQAN